MTPDEYLEGILATQKLEEEELAELRDNRAGVEDVLAEHLGESAPSIQYAGSYKKRTMIRDAYDLDILCYFERDDTSAGETLQEIYDAVCEALSQSYYVERKRSALRVLADGAGTTRADLRIDVVPGRFTDETRTDAFLNQENGEKERLKTNLKTHVEHIRDSGVRDAIKLAKLWKHQRNISIKTFVLELLVVDLLGELKTVKLSEQFTHFLREFRDHSDSLSVTDPANGNNDLNQILDGARGELAEWARLTLEYIENDSWESVFGAVPERGRSVADLSAALGRAAVSTPASRPWLPIR
ncbi:hypothetical protein ACFL0I_05565 [Gemmatimonadota bacterium]